MYVGKCHMLYKYGNILTMFAKEQSTVDFKELLSSLLCFQTEDTLMTTHEAAWYSFGGACMSLLESLDIGSSFSLIRYTSRGYGSNLYYESHRAKVMVTGVTGNRFSILAV